MKKKVVCDFCALLRLPKKLNRSNRKMHEISERKLSPAFVRVFCAVRGYMFFYSVP
jgi:hypothetical protein